MTRRHYVMLAEALKRARLSQYALVADPVLWARFMDIAAKEIADALAADNRAFDRARFLKACGMQS